MRCSYGVVYPAARGTGPLLAALLLGPRAIAGRRELPRILRGYWREVALIGVLSPLAYLLVLYTFRLAPVALVAPARESSIVLGSVLGWLMLGKRNPARRIAGAVIVLAGVVLIGII